MKKKYHNIVNKRISFQGCEILGGHLNTYLSYLFEEHFNLTISDENPDYVFHSLDTNVYKIDKNKVNIFYTAEPITPDFNYFDYAIGFDYITFKDRYLRYPLYLLGEYHDSYKKLNKPKNPKKILAEKKRFCSFVVSNGRNRDPIYEKFFKKLSNYKKVDSGGRLFNNIGGPVKDKQNFIKKYKFNIAFENSKMSGYTTEKLVEAMAVNTMPIYFGDPHVHTEFNDKSFIILKSEEDIDRVIEQIIKLDQDDDAYLKMMSEPWIDKKTNHHTNEKHLLDFFEKIFKQEPIKAKRISNYGPFKPNWLYFKSKILLKLTIEKYLIKIKKLVVF